MICDDKGRWTVVAVIVLAVTGILSGRLSAAENRVCFAQTCYRVEVVADPVTRARGLQGRDHLADDAGMLFVFPAAYPYAFWMKDTLIALDMIWMDKDGRIVHIASDVPPCQRDPCPGYAPPVPAVYVLELDAGEARRAGLHPGQPAGIYLHPDQK